MFSWCLGVTSPPYPPTPMKKKSLMVEFFVCFFIFVYSYFFPHFSLFSFLFLYFVLFGYTKEKENIILIIFYSVIFNVVFANLSLVPLQLGTYVYNMI